MTSFLPQLEVNSEDCFLPCFSSQTLFDDDIIQVSYTDQENQHMYHEDIMMNQLYDQLGSEVEGIESRVQDATSKRKEIIPKILQRLQLNKVFSHGKKNVPANVIYQETTKRQQLLQQKQLSTTEKAGRRLYRQALERNARLLERKERSKPEPKKLELATKYSFRLKSMGTSASSISTSSLSLSSSDSSSSSPLRSRNMRACQRLYDLSKPKQMRGKQRRDEITKARERRANRKFEFPSSKITIEEAISIYTRGMKHLYALEERRIASFAKREIAYQSYLIPETSTC